MADPGRDHEVMNKTGERSRRVVFPSGWADRSGGCGRRVGRHAVGRARRLRIAGQQTFEHACLGHEAGGSHEEGPPPGMPAGRELQHVEALNDLGEKDLRARVVTQQLASNNEPAALAQLPKRGECHGLGKEPASGKLKLVPAVFGRQDHAIRPAARAGAGEQVLLHGERQVEPDQELGELGVGGMGILARFVAQRCPCAYIGLSHDDDSRCRRCG